jgi:hypothetical protein
MTLHLTHNRPKATVHYIHRDITVPGTPTQLANIIANHRRKGTFVGVTDAVPLTAGRTQITLRLREPQASRPGTRVTAASEHARARVRRPRQTRTTVIVAAVVGTAAGLIAVAAYLFGQLVELIAAHAGMVLGVLALAAVLAAAAHRRSSNRRHFPGC